MAEPNAEQQAAQEKEMQKLSFMETLHQLPAVLLTEMLKHFAAALLMLIGTVIMLVTTNEATWAAGFLIALFPIYSSMDIVWSYAANKVLVARVTISKAKRTRKGAIDMIVRDAKVTDLTQENIETCRIKVNASLRDRGLLTEGTVMDIYIKETNPGTALAYKIIG